MARRSLLFLAVLLFSGCSAGPAPASKSPCFTSHTSIAAMQGEAGYNETWTPDEVRGQLSEAGFLVRESGTGLQGTDPAGRNVTLARSSEPAKRYLVTFEGYQGELQDEARLRAAVEPAFRDSVRLFENATGWQHGGAFVQPIFMVADYVPC